MDNEDWLRDLELLSLLERDKYWVVRENSYELHYIYVVRERT